MAIYMPPLCRRKKVLDRYNPDSFRVISQFAEEGHTKHEEEGNYPSEWRKKWLENQGLALPNIYNRRTEVFPHTVPDFRANRPHPGSCGFLRHNVRLLNEPICSVYTEISSDDNQHWWPSRVSNEPLCVPPRTHDTIYRADFLETTQDRKDFGSSRHTANPNKEPALGTVPVNFLRPKDGNQRLFKEKISYEHQYNSRIDLNYPIRGKRQGSFVWDPMSAEASNKFINHYKVITAEEGIRQQEIREAEKMADEVTKLLEKSKVNEISTVAETACIQKVPEPTTTLSSEPAVCKPENHAPEEKKGSPVHSAKITQANSEQVSPKHPSSGKKPTSKPNSPKKVASRKNSASVQFQGNCDQPIEAPVGTKNSSDEPENPEE
ncbi:uncharacterized protein LOC127872826 [Dreissena polymorpha]|uniref:uncharacterized protein LOC127872826 n=1 Tax=Dreissena polymorpha TaxID=45954 RepID=UPI0022641D1A|nr:uncharacterized protein LOC127872826 [Dreissena polymorpha]